MADTIDQRVLTRVEAEWEPTQSGVRRPAFDEPALALAAELPFPTDWPRPASCYRGASESLAMPSDLVDALEQRSWLVADSEGDPRLPVLLATFVVLLCRYSGETDMLVGIAAGAGTEAESRSAAASFRNAVPVRFDLADDPRFRELVERVSRRDRETRGDRGDADNAPSRIVLAEDEHVRGTCNQFLFGLTSAVMVGEDHAFGRLNRVVRPDLAPLGNELMLGIERRERRLVCTLQYNAELFDTATVRRMLGHFEVLLRGGAANPEERISALPLLTDAERRQLIEEWNQPAAATPSSSGKFYHEAFAAQAAQTPDSVAVVFEERQLTYREVDERSNQLAHFLGRHGVGPDILVGICLERSPDLVLGLLAILKAGGAFVPLEPSYPAARLSELLSETRPAVLITQSRLLARLTSQGRTVICVDLEREAIATESSAAPDVRVTGENLAAVIFSSGSTGKPKAIARPHRAYRFGDWARSTFQLCESDRHMLKTSLDSSLLVRELVWPLLTGGRMIIAGPHENSDAAALLRLLIDHKITIITLVPSLLRLLVAEEGLEACTSLRHVICFGEPLPVDVEERFCHRLPAALGISYGTTEAPALTFRQCLGGGPRPLGNLGYRLGKRRIYIVDARLQPVPIGVPGELVAGGQGLAAGYLNTPDSNEERFVQDPFSQDPGARLFRTGDRARWRSDGSLEFMGRLDDQIKIGGYRIEPMEVEAALLRHSGVREAVVVARRNRDGVNQLVAYLVAGPHGPTVSELRTHLGLSLPAHMIPSIFVGLERLPRRPNGKTDRNALPSQELNRLESGDPFVAPRTVLEETLARIWCDVLGNERLSVHDSFFNLGGTSLLAGRLVSQIQKSCGRHLSLGTLFLHPTVAQLAEILETGEIARSHRSIIEVRRGGSRPPLYFPPIMVGGAFICDAVLAQLPPDQPVYAYTNEGHSAENPRVETMEAMALRLCEELSVFQPDGPICLAGYSFGGLLAYEMARHLSAWGRQVKLLAIIDIGPGRITPLGPGSALRASWLFLRNLPHWIPHLLLGRSRARAKLIKLSKKLSSGCSRPHRSQLPEIADNIVSTNDRPDDVRSPMTDYLRALAERRYPPYTGRAVLFRAQSRPLLHSHLPDLGWSDLILGGLDIVHLSGNHGTIVQEPHVHELAREFRAALDAAVEGHDHAHCAGRSAR